jgi:ankyrin repeat protein
MHDLVERGVDVNADTDGKGTTPLMLAILYAVRFKHGKSQMDVLDWLGQHWADPDIPDKYGMTPLMLACLKASPEIVRILVEDGGADVNAVDKNGMTALIYAMWAMTNSSQRSRYNTRKHLYKLNEAESYYRKRTHVNSDILYEKFHHKQSPHTKIVRFLCQHGADPNIIDKYGKKAIDYLRSSQYMTLRNILLEGCPPMKSTYTSTEGGYRRRSKTKRNHHRNKQTKRIARK